MTKINKHIEIVRSSKNWLSSMSLESSNAIFNVLKNHYTNVSITTVNNLSDLKKLVKNKPDLVFLGMKFISIDEILRLEDPSKIWITQYLKDHKIAHTGSTQFAHELEFNKSLAKKRIIKAGLKTSPFYVVKQNCSQIREDKSLIFPLFIKPINRGGGLGIDSDSVVHNFEELCLKVRLISKRLHTDSLIEEYLPGREFSVAILKDRIKEGYHIMPIELVSHPDKYGRLLLSKKVKESNIERVLVVTDQSIKSKITDLSIKAFHALGARDYGRIDIRLDKNGTPHFLEANLIPSLINGYGSFPKACMLNINLEYEAMILNIVKLALSRSIL